MGEEAKLEKWARYQGSLHGGLMFKWVSPGRRGVPDNIVIWQRSWRAIEFIEFKAPNEEPDENQEEMHAMLRAFGYEVHVFTTREQVIEWLQAIEWLKRR